MKKPLLLEPNVVERYMVNFGIMAQGFVQASVVKDGKVLRTYPVQQNLILDNGLNLMDISPTADPGGRGWEEMMRVCVAGTGTTPTKQLVSGTASQTTTVVTLVGSAYSFVSGDVGSWIKWTSGEQCKITAFTNSTTVTVTPSQSVASGSVVGLYRCNQTGLTTEVKRAGHLSASPSTAYYPVFTKPDTTASQGCTFDQANDKITLRRTFDFTAEVGGVNYTEIGLSYTTVVASNLFSRILLSGAVSVAIGEQLRIEYNLVLQLHGITSRPSGTMTFTGWPIVYNVASITSTGSDFTITTSAAHHYAAAGKVNLAGIKKPRFTITAASSTGVDFTLTTSGAHGRSPGDSIIVEGVTPSGYNGTWTCASGTTGSTIVVTSVANPGTGTVFGNVRLAEPGTWYNQEWTIASVTSTTIVVTSALNLGTVNANEGTAFNNTKYAFHTSCWSLVGVVSDGRPAVGNTQGANNDTLHPMPVNAGQGMFDPRSYLFNVLWSNGVEASPTFDANTTDIGTATGRTNATSSVKASYVTGNFYQEWTTEWNAGSFTSQNIRTIAVITATDSANIGVASNARCVHAKLQMEERQQKDASHKLQIIMRRSFGRVLN